MRQKFQTPPMIMVQSRVWKKQNGIIVAMMAIYKDVFGPSQGAFGSLNGKIAKIE